MFLIGDKKDARLKRNFSDLKNGWRVCISNGIWHGKIIKNMMGMKNSTGAKAGIAH